MATKFPQHDINPVSKNEDWHLQFAKAAWDEYVLSSIKIGYNNRSVYKEIMDYVLGQQSIEKYKKAASIDEESDPSWVNSDWSVRKITEKLRDIGLAKITQQGYNIVATPIDIMAKDEQETYYNKQISRLQMQEAAKLINPEILNNPAFIKEPGDPEDMEELEMIMSSGGVKLKVAMEAEMGVEYVFSETKNNFKQKRRVALENWWDYSIGGYKEYVDESSSVKIRNIDPFGFMCSPFKLPDATDARYLGEVIEVSVGDLPFDKETRKKIAEGVRNKSGVWGGSTVFGDPWDSERVDVLDLVFKTWNDRIYEKRQNSAGEIVSRRAKYENMGKVGKSKTVVNGEEVDRYEKRTTECVQKVKWIIGTDYVYECGPETYQKRQKPNKAVTYYPYHLYITHFQKMRSSSMMQRLIPIIDEYHNTIFKIENFKAKWVPYIINLDLDALENTALGDGGEKLTEKEILEMVFQNFVALHRKMNSISGGAMNPNHKVVEINPTGMHHEYTVLASDLARLLGEMRDVLGLNDLTDGSTPGERTLNYVASLGDQATNNALYPIRWADISTTESLAKGCLLRLVLTVREREIEGLTRTLGDETVKFFRVTKDICDRIWDVKIESKPTDAQKQALIDMANMKENQGLIGPDDIFMIINSNNLKQAQQTLAYRVKKRRKEMEESKRQDVLANGKVQQESAIVAEEQKRETLKFEYDLKMKLERLKIQGNKEIEAIKAGSKNYSSELSAISKISAAQEEQPEGMEATE